MTFVGRLKIVCENGTGDDSAQRIIQAIDDNG
jgi:hypothetical protein